MITSRDIEFAFVRAQNRINEQIEIAQTKFNAPDVIDIINFLANAGRRNNGSAVNENNPLANEEI